ncbi:MAG: hypothetical protein JXA66_08820, partial [Oligoflexia bacterium]|nr:hypothetical protein [Oligoflexia bacterium]
MITAIARIAAFLFIFCIPVLHASVRISNSAVTNTKYIAVLGDLDTCTDILEELNLYIKAISGQDYGAFLLCDQWRDSAHVKREIEGLYRQKNIEGALMFGNIPGIKLYIGGEKPQNLKETFETNYYYENFNSRFALISRDRKYEYYFLKKPESGIERNIYVSRIPVDPDNEKGIRDFFVKLANIHYDNYSKPVRTVTGVIDDSFMSGSDYAVRSDSAVLKETINYFYNDKGAEVSYLKYGEKETEKWNRKDSNLGYLFFKGDKKSYLKSSRSDVLVVTGLEKKDVKYILSGKQYAALSFNESIRYENIFPPFYYIFFAGHMVGG